MSTRQDKFEIMAEYAFARALENGEVTQDRQAAFTRGFMAAFAYVDEEMAAYRRHVADVERLATLALGCSSSPVVMILGRPEILDEAALPGVGSPPGPVAESRHFDPRAVAKGTFPTHIGPRGAHYADGDFISREGSTVDE